MIEDRLSRWQIDMSLERLVADRLAEWVRENENEDVPPSDLDLPQ